MSTSAADPNSTERIPGDGAMVVWYPSHRCQLACAYCNARSLPVVSHGRERTSQEWARVWAATPWKLDSMVVCGTEPSLYEGLAEALAPATWPVHINTNMVRDPRQWYTERLGNQVKGLTVGWHHHPEHAAAAGIWEHLHWTVAYRINPRWVTVCHIVEPQRTLPAECEAVRQKCCEIGVNYWGLEFDDAWLWRDWRPERRGAAVSCSGGSDHAVVLADGSAYRCLGHAYGGREPLGNVVDDGWDVLARPPQPCADLVCTCYQLCDRVTTVYAGGGIPNWKHEKPGRRYPYQGNYCA